MTLGWIRFRDVAEGTMLSAYITPLISAKVLLIRAKPGEIQFCMS
jgi:hypothetical protein